MFLVYNIRLAQQRMQIYTLNINKQMQVTDTGRLCRYIESLCEQLHLRGTVSVSPLSLSVNLEGSNELLVKLSMYLQEQVPIVEDDCRISPTSLSLANGLEVKELHPEKSAFAAA